MLKRKIDPEEEDIGVGKRKRKLDFDDKTKICPIPQLERDWVKNVSRKSPSEESREQKAEDKNFNKIKNEIFASLKK